jgi:hypothetical protein
MLDNVNRYAVVADSYCSASRVLQLKKILLIFIYLSFINLPNLVLIAPAKRLAYLNLANLYCCVTVAQRMQLYTQLLACLAL